LCCIASRVRSPIASRSHWLTAVIMLITSLPAAKPASSDSATEKCSSSDELAAKQHSRNSLSVRDIAERISVQDQEVSRLTRLNRTVLVELTHELCWPERGCLYGPPVE
jgi:hypothetical protein